MPSCGCPDVKQEDGSMRPCPCKPCSEGNLAGCSCNKKTQCACFNDTANATSCTCGNSCTCPSCDCTTAPGKQIDSAPKSCCGSKGTEQKKVEREEKMAEA